MVQYLHFGILKFPLTDLELTLVVSRSWTISIAWQVFAPSIEKSQLHYQVPLQRTPSHAHLMLQTCNMPAGMGSRRARKRQTCVFCSYFWQKIAVIKKNISENLNLVAVIHEKSRPRTTWHVWHVLKVVSPCHYLLGLFARSTCQHHFEPCQQRSLVASCSKRSTCGNCRFRSYQIIPDG